MRGSRIISIFILVVYLSTLMLVSTGCSLGNKAETTGTISESDKSNDKENENSSPENTESYTDNSGDKYGIISAPVFTSRQKEAYKDIEFTPTQYEKKVKPYTIKSDLSNIENLKQFGTFTKEQTGLLSKNGFLAAPTDEEQLFYIYENNQYMQIPSFVTTDSVLQVYHIFFDYSLRTLEKESLIGILEKLTDNMLKKSIHMYENLENSKVKEEALRVIAFCGVAQLALEKKLPENTPDEARLLAEKEFELILAEGSFTKSPIFGFKLDYSQYIPRGHYTRSDDFKRYFRAMMWYGQAPFPLYTVVDGKKMLDRNMTARALLLTCNIFMSYDGVPDIELWNKIYNPTEFYVGSTDDLNVYDYKDLILKVYGQNPDLNTLMDDDKMEALHEEAKKLPEPQIQAKWTTVNTPVGKQFRLMGQRYIPDSEILQKLVEPYFRPIPSGLDVMGVLGSEKAHDILVSDYKVIEQWDGYQVMFDMLKKKFAATGEDKWRSNMYYGWLWTLKSLLEPKKTGYPSFMTSEAWVDKSLNTALGSWSELRHDTILYGKQSGAEMGGDEIIPLKSYVEPNVELYERLSWLTRYSRENLIKKEILPVDLEYKMEEFERLLELLKTCSLKELRNEALTEDENYMLFTYGAWLESLTSSLSDNSTRWFEITSETDKNMAVIADVHTAGDHYLEAGVGSASQIFVVVPIEGKLYLTRGAVFSYFEFVSDKRLTDEEWQKMLKEGRQPSQPQWTNSFQAGEKTKLPVLKKTE